ncbi:hypothetical protein KCTCHS21_28880 [Cohnella abietis]|uniref:Uncharacterized protein n=1 Tax=Cohnella abietis TaxID=2507935 RepID=A0A3T1D615_9BACL|nr:hypothetical protein KCTCHS21_28880 [Cohnella abietis]
MVFLSLFCIWSKVAGQSVPNWNLSLPYLERDEVDSVLLFNGAPRGKDDFLNHNQLS